MNEIKTAIESVNSRVNKREELVRQRIETLKQTSLKSKMKKKDEKE